MRVSHALVIGLGSLSKEYSAIAAVAALLAILGTEVVLTITSGVVIGTIARLSLSLTYLIRYYPRYTSNVWEGSDLGVGDTLSSKT